MRHAVLIELATRAYRPTRPHPAVRDAAIAMGGSLFLATCAQVSVPMVPVPFTLQTFGVLVLGFTLGGRRAAAATGLYLLEGAAGLPVFQGLGVGLPHLLGPTGGYLFAFVPAAFVTGCLAQRGWDRRFGTAFAAGLLGSAVIFVGGVPWLAVYFGWGVALTTGLWPFVPAACVKVGLAALMLPTLWQVVGPRTR